MKRVAKWLAMGAGIAGASYGIYAASAWLRYGRPRRARGGDSDALLDMFMPIYGVYERHRVAVPALAEVTLAAHACGLTARVAFHGRPRTRHVFNGRRW